MLNNYFLLTRTSGDGFWRVELSEQTLDVINETSADLRKLGVKSSDMKVVVSYENILEEH